VTIDVELGENRVWNGEVCVFGSVNTPDKCFCWAYAQHTYRVEGQTNRYGMVQELTHRYTHVEAGLVENVVIDGRPTQTPTRPAGSTPSIWERCRI
jgi:hypothetical protein